MREEQKNQKSSFWANLFKSNATIDDLYHIIKNIPLFSNLGKNHFKYLYELLHYRSYQTNEYVFYQGDPGNALYIVIEGSIKIKQFADNETEYELAELKSGEFLGELALIDDDIRSASAIASCNTKLAVIFNSDLNTFMKKYPTAGVEIMKNIGRVLSTRLRNLDSDYSDLLNKFNNKLEEQ